MKNYLKYIKSSFYSRLFFFVSEKSLKNRVQIFIKVFSPDIKKTLLNQALWFFEFCTSCLLSCYKFQPMNKSYK